MGSSSLKTDSREKAGGDEARLEERLAELRCRFGAMAANEPLLNLKQGKRTSWRTLEVAAETLHEALLGGDDVALLPRPASGDGVAAGSAHTDLAAEKHDRWLLWLAHQTRGGGAGNNLYLVYGLLTLPDADGGEAALAPLLFIPARLVQSKISNRSHGRQARIAYCGGAAMGNWALDDMLRRKHGCALPSPADGETPARFLDRVEEALDDATGARVLRQVVLGRFDLRPAMVVRDLDPACWRAAEPLWRHPNVARLLGGEQQPEPVPPAVDVERLLVHPADEAQRAWVSAALGDSDLVVEGLPGSGRSQTLANMIAAAMEQGQKILLVAEAPRYLEAVRRLLDEAGLGDFCLTSPTGTANTGRDIARRIERLGHFREPSGTVDPAQAIADGQKELGEHGTRLDSGRNRLGLTPRQVLVGALKHREALGDPMPPLRGVDMGDTAALDAPAMARAEADLGRFVRALDNVSSAGSGPAGHPWHGVTRASLTPSDWSALADVLTTWQNTAGPVEDALDRLAALTGISMPRDLETTAALASLFEAMPEDLAALDPELLGRAMDQGVGKELRALSGKLEQVGALENKCSRFFGTLEGLPAGQAAALDKIFGEVEALGLADLSVGDLSRLGQVAGEAAGLIAVLAPGFAALASRLGDKVTLSIQGLRQLQTVISLAKAAPVEALPIRDYVGDDFGGALAKAEQEAQALQRMARALADTYDLAKTPHPRVLAHATRDLARGGALRALSGDWRRAKGVYHKVARSRRRQDRKQMQRGLERLLAYQEHLAAFSRHVGYRQALGAGFQGMKTDFAAYQALLEWQQMVRQRTAEIGNGAAGEALLTLRQGDIQALAELPQAIAPWHQALVKLLEIWPQVTELVGDGDQEFDKMQMLLAEIDDAARRVGSGLERLRPDLSVAVGQMRGGLALLGDYDEMVRAVGGAGLAAGVTATMDLPNDLLLGCLQNTVAMASALKGVPFAERLTDWLSGDATRIADLHSELAAVRKAKQAWDNAFDVFAELGHVEKDLWLVAVERPCSFDAVRKRGARALDAMGTLSGWVDYLRAASVLEAAGLARLGELVEQGSLAKENIGVAFKALVFDALGRDILIDRPRLATTGGRQLDALHNSLMENDRALHELARARIAHKLDRAAVAYGAAEGAGAFEALAKMKGGLAPKLSGAALQVLKPCFMMTPLEVASRLDPETVTFDLVIVHCGSPMSVATALGSVAHGRRLIVVGDWAEMPGDEETPGDGAMDLLAAARAGLATGPRLKTRYGGDQNALFSFINGCFYGGEISLAPSPRPTMVETVPVGGTYDRGLNRAEADKIVDAALDHMLARPGESLGMVAMTRKQALLIEEELQRRAAALPGARAFMKAREAGQEPVRVWVAAAAGGEARDNILISVTFGPNSSGQLLQSFPGLNGPQGWRPIHGMVVSVRKRLGVYASIDAQDVLAGAESGPGVRALRDLLNLGGAPAADGEAAAEPQTEGGLLAVVGAALARRGIEVAGLPDCGVGGALLGVRHPLQDGTFILGLVDAAPETSSGWRRQVSLAARGWQLQRLYAPDCFGDLDGVVRSIVRRIEIIQASEKRRARRGGVLGDQVMAFKRAVMASESLDWDDGSEEAMPLTLEEARCALVALREHVIKPACPATDPAHGLLREPLLDLLLVEAPRTPEAFRSAISVKQLQETDAAQLEAYLGQVLEIVARIAT